MSIVISVHEDATMQFIYSDELRGLMDEGDATIKRASHVEPDDDLTWHADMSPVGGPVLSGFPTREAALRAEVEWINDNHLTGQSSLQNADAHG
jgi:hypothetical protein